MIKINKSKRYFFLIFIIQGIALFIINQKHGIKIVCDSPRYLNYADKLTEGMYFDPHNFWYFAYVVYVYVCNSISGGSVSLIIYGQYILNILAVFLFYKTIVLLYSKPKIAFLGTLFFITFYEISLWSTYILSESLYVSLLCFCFYFLTKLYLQKASKIDKCLGFCLLFISVLAKPTAVALLAAILFSGLFLMLKKSKFKVLNYCILALSVFLFFGLLEKMLTTFHWVDRDYVKGEIIYGTKGLVNYRKNLDGLFIVSKTKIKIPSKQLPEVIRLFVFVYQNSTYWFTLFFHKSFYFISHTRPYWSIYHNIFSILYLVVLYLCFLLALIKKNHSKLVLLFSFSFLLLQFCAVTFSTVDWDGRFLLPCIPLLILLSAKELYCIFEALLSANHKLINLLKKVINKKNDEIVF